MHPITVSSILVLLLSLLIAYNMTHWPISDQQYKDHITGKVFLLSGASSGIGEEITYQLAALGARVVITARSVDKLERVRENAVKIHGAREVDIHVMQCDMSDIEQAINLVPNALAVFGRIDHLILNQAATPMGPFLNMKSHQNPEFIERVYRTNVFSNIQAAIAAKPELEKTGGHILVTSSTAGEGPFMIAGLYSSSKHALNGFFYSLQQELAAIKSSVTVSIAALGLIKTKEVGEIVDHMTGIPEFFKGDLSETARVMIDNFIVRSPTMSYPKVFMAQSRLLVWLKPIIGDLALLDPNIYENLVTLGERAKELSRTTGYQKGNL